MSALRHRQTRACLLIAATLLGLLVAQAHAVELLVNQQTGAVTVLAAPNPAASQTAEKSLRSEEQLAKTAKWLGENSNINRLRDDALLAITLQSNGKVSTVMPLVGERARIMDRPMQKAGVRGVGSQALYVVPEYLQDHGAEVQLWKKESNGRFSFKTSL
ncbi:hypothetical protein OMB55_00023580 [gamma proteobacterium HIMB55]|nr:hypothetical protein OMB55_00023580 [gamma proteobacterium HIMB55]